MRIFDSIPFDEISTERMSLACGYFYNLMHILGDLEYTYEVEVTREKLRTAVMWFNVSLREDQKLREVLKELRDGE